jgi:hypothetical protein
MHWDGRDWRVVPSPDVEPNNNGAQARLQAVAAATANDVWAVGYHSTPGFPADIVEVRRPLVMHWDGTTWKIVPSPDPSTNGHLEGVAVVSATDIWAVGGYVKQSSSQDNPDGTAELLLLHWDGRSWSQVAGPHIDGVSNTLYGVAAVSANDVWAVGGTGDLGGNPIAVHWDGKAWSHVPSPTTGAHNGTWLSAVTALSADDVWAVGGAQGSPFVVHWDGKAWSWIGSPSESAEGQLFYGGLNGVVGLSPAELWAVGGFDSGTPGASDDTIIMRYGQVPCYSPTVTRTPSRTPTPSRTATITSTFTAIPTGTPFGLYAPHTPVTLPPGQTVQAACGTWTVFTGSNFNAQNIQIGGMSAASADDIWAVGSYVEGPSSYMALILHWDGKTWKQMIAPIPKEAQWTRLQGVSALAWDDVWAVGEYEGRYENETRVTFAIHWDGRAWSHVPSPNGVPDPSEGLDVYSYLTGVAAIKADDVWAVGGYQTTKNTRTHTLTLHWDGKAWTRVDSPGKIMNHLLAVDGTSGDDVWAVGSYSDGPGQAGTLALHWDGREWTEVATPDADEVTEGFQAVAAFSRNDVWAVGSIVRSPSVNNVVEVLIGHWDGKSWSISPTSDLKLPDRMLTGVAALSMDDVWAVGPTLGGALLLLHWDGNRWTPMAGTNVPLDSTEAYSVAAIAHSDIWAAGTQGGQVTLGHYVGSACATPGAGARP